MVIEFIDEPKKPASDLVNEARELIRDFPEVKDAAFNLERALFADAVERQNESSFWGHSKKIAQAYYRAPALLSALCDELDQQSSRIATQAESLSTCHDRMKLMKEAIEEARTWICRVSNQYMLGADDPHEVLVQLREAITPKGEQSP